jgi:hypothetical protein
MPAKAGSSSAQDDTDWSMASSRARSSRSDRDSRTTSGGVTSVASSALQDFLPAVQRSTNCCAGALLVIHFSCTRCRWQWGCGARPRSRKGNGGPGPGRCPFQSRLQRAGAVLGRLLSAPDIQELELACRVRMPTSHRHYPSICGLQVVDALRCLPSEAALRALNPLGQAVSSIQISTVRSVPAYIMSIIAKHQPGREGRLRDPPREFPEPRNSA